LAISMVEIAGHVGVSTSSIAKAVARIGGKRVIAAEFIRIPRTQRPLDSLLSMSDQEGDASKQAQREKSSNLKLGTNFGMRGAWSTKEGH
jgi:hypothetical protein